MDRETMKRAALDALKRAQASCNPQERRTHAQTALNYIELWKERDAMIKQLSL